MGWPLIERVRGWLMPKPFWIKDLGRHGEYLARRYLHRLGYHLVARNWRKGHWELDLIMAKQGQLLVVEVKTRTQAVEPRIGDTLRFHQQQRLRSLATRYRARLKPGPPPTAFWLMLVWLPPGQRGIIRRAVLPLS